MKVNKMKYIFLVTIIFLFNVSSYASDSAGCDLCETKLTPKSHILLLSDQIKKVNKFNYQAKSNWAANSLSKQVCIDILKEISDNKIDIAIIPEIQSVVDIVKAECGEAKDPLVVVKEIIPFGIEGTSLYFSWDEESGKLTIKNKHKFKDTDYAFQYAKKDLESAPLVLNDNQLKILSKSEMYQIKDKNLNELESRSIVSKWWDSTKNNVLKIMNSPQTDVYLPMLAYHDRRTYGAEHIKELNEKALGLGVGKSLTNENGNTEMVFAMAHLDSHGQVEVNVGYGWQKNYKISENIKAGVGYAAGVVSREDLYNRIPVPFVFPMGSLTIDKKLSINGVYIPSLGGVNNGSVLFVFGKYTFEK